MNGGALSGRGSIFLGARRFSLVEVVTERVAVNLRYRPRRSWSSWFYQRYGRRVCDADSRSDRRKALAHGKPLASNRTTLSSHRIRYSLAPLCTLRFRRSFSRYFRLEIGIYFHPQFTFSYFGPKCFEKLLKIEIFNLHV